MAPPIFLPYQRRWVLDRSPVKVCEKSRRIGITWATAYEAVEVAGSAKEEGGANFWYQTYAEDDAKEFIEDAAKFARALDLAIQPEEETLGEDEAREYFLLPDGEKSIKINSIRFSSGFRVTALPHLPRKLRGKGGVYCLDEAAFHDNMAEALKAAHAFRMWGGRVIIISTHNGVDNPFNLLCEDVRGGRLSYSLHKYTLIDAVSQGLYKRICYVQGKEWTSHGEEEFVAELLATEGAEEEFLCVPSRSGGRYIPVPLVDATSTADATVLRLRFEDAFMMKPEGEREEEMEAWCIANVEPVLKRLPKNKPHYLGVDFGRNSDISAWCPGTLQQDLSLRFPFIVETRNVPFEQQKQLAFWLIPRLPRFTHGSFDSTGNGAYLGEVALQRFGESQIEAVKLNDPWYAANLPKLKARFEDASIVIPKDLDVRQDLGMLEVINGVPKLPKLKVSSKVANAKKGDKRHGDVAIGLALATYSASLFPPSDYDYEPVAARRDGELVPRKDKNSKRAGHFAMKGLW